MHAIFSWRCCAVAGFVVVAGCSAPPPPEVRVEVRNEHDENTRFLVGFASEDAGGKGVQGAFFPGPSGQLIAGHSDETSPLATDLVLGKVLTFNFSTFSENDLDLRFVGLVIDPIVEHVPESGTYQFIYALDPLTQSLRVSHRWKP